MSDIKNVALLGASGSLGRYILPTLLAQNFTVTIIARPESQATFPPTAKVITIPYTLDALTEAFQSQDAVVCAIAVQASALEPTIVDAAVAAGVKRYIPNTWRYNPDEQGIPELQPMGAPKKAISKYVEDKAKENEGFTYSSVACGAFVDWGMKRFPILAGNIPERSVRIFDSGNEEFTGTSIQGIANAVAGILKNPKPTKNRDVLVRSVQTCQNEMVQTLERVTGETWKRENVDSAVELERARAAMEAGDMSAMLSLLSIQLFRDGDGRGRVVSREESDNELVGVQEESIESIVRRVLDPKELPL